MRRDGVEHGVHWIPEAALDVIQYTLMTDPVIAEDNHTCEAALDFIVVDICKGLPDSLCSVCRLIR